jgi:hypothetical protein
MNVVDFPKQKPRPNKLQVPRERLAQSARAVSLIAMAADEHIKAAHTAEELAAAIRSMHEALMAHVAAWAELVDATRHWR